MSIKSKVFAAAALLTLAGGLSAAPAWDGATARKGPTPSRKSLLYIGHQSRPD
jgi:hypothetical protein